MQHRVNLIRTLDSEPEGFANAEDLCGVLGLLLAAQVELDGLGRAAYQIDLTLCDDAHIAELNAEHRGRSGPTDVLSFPLLDFPAGPGASILPRDAEGRVPRADLAALSGGFPAPEDEAQLLGDIVISLETCAAQAQSVGHGIRDELLRLFVHGMLHLFGYDHETGVADEARMRAREDELLARVD